MATSASTAQAAAPAGFRRFWRAVKQLFHEVIGAIFAILALTWLNSAVRAWSRDVALWLIAVAGGVGLVFAFFAITQFRRARRI